MKVIGIVPSGWADILEMVAMIKLPDGRVEPYTRMALESWLEGCRAILQQEEGKEITLETAIPVIFAREGLREMEGLLVEALQQLGG